MPPDHQVAVRKVQPSENPEYVLAQSQPDAVEAMAAEGRVLYKRRIREQERKISIFIQPTEDDMRRQNEDGSFKPDVVRLDGTAYTIVIGEMNTLPESVWEAYRVSKKMARVRVPGVWTAPIDGDIPSAR